MKVGPYSVVSDGARVEVLLDGVLVATGRWTGKRVEDCSFVLASQGHPAAAPIEEMEPGERAAWECAQEAREVEPRVDLTEDFFAEIESRLAEEQAAQSLCRALASQNEEGVDVALIDWTLSLTPRERLERLQAMCDMLAGSVNDESPSWPIAPRGALRA